jgi:hypothetical protein
MLANVYAATWLLLLPLLLGLGRAVEALTASLDVSKTHAMYMLASVLNLLDT